MDIAIKHGSPAKQKTACFIVPVYSGKNLGSCATALDKSARGALDRLVQRGDISGKAQETLLVPNASGLAAERVLLIGAGKKTGISAAAFIKLVQKAASAVAAAKLKNALCALDEITVEGRDTAWKIRQQAAAFAAISYRFDAFKTVTKRRTPRFARLGIYLESSPDAAATQEARISECVANGMRLTKDLANTPANHCTPQDLANQARQLAETHGSLNVDVLSEASMEKLGMGALLSVSRGSVQEAKLITMQYQGGEPGGKPVVLVGKGVTFDSGGISIKAGPGMDEMKYDMCGAATVFGVMSAVAEAGLPINLVGVVPATENLPDGKATKPGDIVTSMSGQTIEILNTDAEGRLILCDALTYSARFEPDVVIDIATLTGACIIALGSVNSGLMSNDDALADELLRAAENSGDGAWRLPVGGEYQKQIDSPFADIANVGGREAGSVTAASFLARFTKDFRWAHLDIAGTAWRSGKDKAATGRPVPLLMQFLRERIAASQ